MQTYYIALLNLTLGSLYSVCSHTSRSTQKPSVASLKHLHCLLAPADVDLLELLLQLLYQNHSLHQEHIRTGSQSKSV